MSTRRITAARPFSWTTLALALGHLAMGLPGMAESVDPAVARRVARIELARSIRAFAASTLPAGTHAIVRASDGKDASGQVDSGPGDLGHSATPAELLAEAGKDIVKVFQKKKVGA